MITICSNCENEKEIVAKGLCRRCYMQQRRQSFTIEQKEAVKVQEKAYKELNRERLCEERLTWYYKNKEQAQQKHKEWLQANKDKVKQYEKEHKQERSGYTEARRARKAKVKSELTGKQWEKLIEVYEHKCAYCLQEFSTFEQDHVIPISRGGEHTMFNVVPACRACNRQKSTNIITPIHPAYFNMLACSAYLLPVTVS